MCHGITTMPNNHLSILQAIASKQASKQVGLLTEKSIEEYLILLSIYQTCKYRRINFLKFLLSKETDLDVYVSKHPRKKSNF